MTYLRIVSIKTEEAGIFIQKFLPSFRRADSVGFMSLNFIFAYPYTPKHTFIARKYSKAKSYP